MYGNSIHRRLNFKEAELIIFSQMFHERPVQHCIPLSPPLDPTGQRGGYKINLRWSLKSVFHSDKTRFLTMGCCYSPLRNQSYSYF